MRHHILVKWNDTMPHPDIAPIRALFLETLRIPGIHDVSPGVKSKQFLPPS